MSPSMALWSWTERFLFPSGELLLFPRSFPAVSPASHADVDASLISVTSHGAVFVTTLCASLPVFCVRFERVEQPVCFEYMCGVKKLHEHELNSTVSVPSR